MFLKYKQYLIQIQKRILNTKGSVHRNVKYFLNTKYEIIFSKKIFKYFFLKKIFSESILEIFLKSDNFTRQYAHCTYMTWENFKLNPYTVVG